MGPIARVADLVSSTALTDRESAAVLVIEALREDELDSVWHLGRESAGPTSKWLGMPFTSAKEHIHESKLFQFIRQVALPSR